MAIIPAGSKVMTVASTVDTNERKSTQANSPTQYYSIEDITETATVYDNGTSGLTATTMQDAIDEVSANVDALPAAPTTCVVTIPSAASGEFITYSDGRPNVENGILGMGSSPIELLPAPGAGKYYDIEKIILEYTHVTTAYNVGTIPSLRVDDTSGSTRIYSVPWFLTETENTFAVIDATYNPSEDGGSSFYKLQGYGYLSTNQPWTLSTSNTENPTLGDGTLRAIITYTTRTFGA